MSMMSKILPINLDPDIKVYTTHAFQLSIASQHKNYLPWFYSNFIQLTCFMDFSISPYTPINFYTGTIARDFHLYRSMPLIDSQLITRKALDEMIQIDIVDFVKKGIENDQYSYLHVNDFYIEGRPNWHFTHEILVYGYDDENQILHVTTFNGSVYGTVAVPYPVFRQAYESLVPEPKFQSIYLLSVSNNEYAKIDMRFLKHELMLFLYSSTEKMEVEVGRLRNPRDFQVFGKQVYTYLRSNAAKYASDSRPLHLLMEHKQIMQNRLRYLQDQGFIKERDATEMILGFGELYNQLEEIQSIQLNNQVHEEPEFETKLIRMLYAVESQEVNLFHQLLQAIEPATRSFGAYLNHLLEIGEVTIDELSQLSSVDIQTLQVLSHQEKLPWELDFSIIHAIVNALSIRRPLLEQLMHNYSLDSFLRDKYPDRDDISVSQLVVEHYKTKMLFLQSTTDG